VEFVDYGVEDGRRRHPQRRLELSPASAEARITATQHTRLSVAKPPPARPRDKSSTDRMPQGTVTLRGQAETGHPDATLTFAR
jgi:hypothetical protein